MSNSPKLPTAQLIFPNAENTTLSQLNNAIQIGSFALAALMRPGMLQDAGGNTLAVAVEFPPEAKIAAENTLIKALTAMDDLLDDKSRWSMAKQRELEDDFKKAHDLNLAYLDAQAEGARLFTTPHFRFRPTLMRLNDGRMMAILGSADDLDNAIIGLGGSAAEALQRFDETFDNGVPANWVEYLSKREQELAAGKIPTPFQKSNENKILNESKILNENKTLDSRTDTGTKRASKRKPKNPEHS